MLDVNTPHLSKAGALDAMRRARRHDSEPVPIAARLEIRLTPDATESLIYFLAENEAPRHHALRLGWDLHRQFSDDSDLFGIAVAAFGETPPACFDATGSLDLGPWLDAQWATFERARYATDALLIDLADEAIAQGWQAPADLSATVEQLRDLNKSADEAGWPQSEFNGWLLDEFEAARNHARQNPAWLDRLEAAGADFVRWCLALGPDQIPVSNTADDRRRPVIRFIRFVNACIAADANAAHLESEFEAMTEDVAALAKTIEAEVQRTVKNMPTAMTDFVRHPRTQEVLSNNSDNIRFLLKSMSLELRWNNWLERIEIKSADSAHVLSQNPELHWSEWTPIGDHIVSQLRTFAARTHCDFRPNKDFLWDSFYAMARANVVDPAVEKLAELEAKWDGAPRLDTWLTGAAKCPADPYHQAVARNIVGGMVRRIREPGCKHDTVAIFISPQGSGKSTLARLLALDDRWFTDEIMLGDESKELVLSLAGKSVIEIAELNGATRDLAKIKAMLSRQVDRGRTAYARTVSERPRRNIFIASTNDSAPLIDATGNRRFLPVRLGSESEIDLGWAKKHMPQIVGEAAARHSAGADFAIPRDIWADAAQRQEGVRQQARHEILFNEWFAQSEQPVFITAADIAMIVKSIEPSARHYTEALRKLGFVSADKRVGGKPAKVWKRGDLNQGMRLVPRVMEGGTLAPRPEWFGTVTAIGGAGQPIPLPPNA